MRLLLRTFAFNMRKLSIVLLLLLLTIQAKSQDEEATKKFFFGPSIGAHVPTQDLAQRFGMSFSIGPYVGYKFKNNFQIGFDYAFFYGRETKINGLFGDLMTEDGYIINNAGIPANVLTGMRGHMMQFSAGKVFPVIGNNSNSGILLSGGLGFMLHKVGIDHREDEITLLEDEYEKGYDRLTNGFMASGLLAYQNFSNSGRVNFFAGVEYRLGLTQGMRSYNYDTRDSDLGVWRLDGLLGIRAGWYVLIDR